MTDRYPIPDFLRRQPEQPTGPRERPILFSAPMVRAILAGTKTQTRRALKVQPLDILPMKGDKAGCEWIGLMQKPPEAKGVMFRCKFGVPGDRLWVRESWAQPTTLDPGPTFYRADYPACVPPHFENVPPADQVKWKPSIHMRRDQSRILLEIVAVRVERLNDISEADARAEGSPDYEEGKDPPPPDDGEYQWSYRESFRQLWESINGTGSWAANPWVFVISFRRVE